MNKLKFVLRLAVSLSIIIFILVKLDIRNIIGTILDNDPGIFFLLILLHYTSSMLLNSLNIKVILDAMDSKVGYLKALKANVTAYSVGLFLPGKVGEFSLPYFLKEEGVSVGKSSSILVVDKSITLLSFFLISSLGLLLFFDTGTSMRIISVAAIGLVLMGFMVMSESVRGLVKRYILRNHASLFRGFYSSIRYVLKRKKRYVVADFILTLTKLFATSYITYLALNGIFDVQINYLHVPVVTAVGLILTLIPVSISGIGIVEGSSIYLYGILGVEAIYVASVLLSYRLVYYIAGGIILLLRLNAKGSITPGRRTMSRF